MIEIGGGGMIRSIPILNTTAPNNLMILRHIRCVGTYMHTLTDSSFQIQISYIESFVRASPSSGLGLLLLMNIVVRH